MSDLYVDLNIYTTGHVGSLEDPYSWDDFILSVSDSVSANSYFIKGSKEFNDTNFKDVVSHTDVNVGNSSFTVTNNYPTGTPILLISLDPPEPLSNIAVYWVINVNATTIKLALSYNDAMSDTFIELYDEGSGSHSIYQLAVYWPSRHIMHTYLGWDVGTNGPWRLNIMPEAYSFLSLQGFFSDLVLYLPDDEGHAFYFDNVNIYSSFLRLPKNVFCIDQVSIYGCSIIMPQSRNFLMYNGVLANFFDSVLRLKFSRFSDEPSIAYVVNCVTTEADYETFKNDADIRLFAYRVQYGWPEPTWPNWYAAKELWSSEVLGAGITRPPNPGITPYYRYSTGLFGEARTGIGAFYFGTPVPEDMPDAYTNHVIVSATQPQVKKSGSMTCIGWVRAPFVQDGDVLIPLAVADVYGNVLNTDSSIRFEILKDGLDYRLQYAGSKSKLISRNLNIKLDDGNWHMLAFMSDADGNMTFLVDSIEIASEIGSDQYGLPYSVAKSLSNRAGGGKVWAPYIYKERQIIYLYNWRLGVGFNLTKDWIKSLMDIDKIYLRIT